MIFLLLRIWRPADTGQYDPGGSCESTVSIKFLVKLKKKQFGDLPTPGRMIQGAAAKAL